MPGSEVTIIIKTFNRLGSLKRLLRSIDALLPEVPVIVADDSRKSAAAGLARSFPRLDLQYIHLPFDSGLSAGRNAMLAEVKTPWFLLCDDDFVFGSSSHFGPALKLMKEQGLDIVGGDFFNYVSVASLRTLARLIVKERKRLWQWFMRKSVTSRYIGNFRITGDKIELLLTNREPPGPFTRCDVVNNFFLARTAAVSSVGGWDAELKVGEHEDFFYRVRNAGLKVAYMRGFGVKHYPAIRSNYRLYRLRSVEFKKRFASKHGFSRYTEILTDSGEVLFDFSTGSAKNEITGDAQE